MFANPEFTRKTAPVFTDSARYESELIYLSGLRPCIMNDDDDPPKALIELDMFLIPAEDFKEGSKWRTTFYDLTASICLSPEDTIRLIRHLTALLRELFDDHNYLREITKQKRKNRER